MLRKFSILTLVFVVFCGGSAILAPIASAAEHPNIVFILADDLGSADTGFAGGKEINTPNLDKLAATGSVLKQFYVQPLCSPTRAALMTGRYPMRYGLQVGVIRPWADYGLPLEERMLPAALRDAGYTTVIIGKWHLGSFDKAYVPCARGFDHHYGHLFGAIDYYKHDRDGKLDWYRDGKPVIEEGYTTELIAKEAASVIKSQPKNKPIFLYVPFNAVHAPLQVPDDYKKPYSKLKEPRQTYAGMVSAMDKAVGAIVRAIDDTGRRGNTIFVFSSDNGGPDPGRLTDNGSLRAGKGTLYEGGVRVCAFAVWPGHIPAGGEVDQPIHMVDWYPTLLKIAGARVKQKLPLDGYDIDAVLTKGAPSPRSEILLNTTPTVGAIRVGDWKLVVNGGMAKGGEEAAVSKNDTKAGANGKASANNKGKGKSKAGAAVKAKGKGISTDKVKVSRVDGRTVELFNLREDPAEKNNLADSQPRKLKELKARYDVLAKEAAPPKNREE